jgi:UDP-N-acetylmuramate--alanine ligase
VRPDFPLASAVKGNGQIFVGETDESDGSIALWQPNIAVLNNIQQEHLPIEQLRQLFGDFIKKAHLAVTNLDNEETSVLARAPQPGQTILTFSLKDKTATYFAHTIVHTQNGVTFKVDVDGATHSAILNVPGEHNIANALSALAATSRLVPTAQAAQHLGTFTGMKRRLDVIGTANGITVLDDISQNPVNIMSNMRALHMHPGRLLLLFQPHGYGVNNRDRQWFIDGLTESLRADDILYMTDPLYLGGTVNPKYRTSDVVTDPIIANGRNAVYRPTRDECLTEILKIVQPGDRIVVMGARDDSLHQFAHGILTTLQQRSAA